MRPLLYLTGRGKKNRWTRQDRVLSEALLEYEKGLTSDGLPWYVASDPEREFVLDELVDEAAAVREEAEAEYRKGNNVSPGMRLVVLDRGVRGADS